MLSDNPAVDSFPGYQNPRSEDQYGCPVISGRLFYPDGYGSTSLASLENAIFLQKLLI